MGDFRDPPKTVLNKETGEVFDVKYHGFIGLHWTKAVEPGIYTIGATGTGYSYFDGKEWQGGYDYEKGRFKMIFPENSEGSPCFHPLPPFDNRIMGTSCVIIDYKTFFGTRLDFIVPVTGAYTESIYGGGEHIWRGIEP